MHARVQQPLLIRAQDIAPQPWRNGGGRTRELLTWPPGAQPWQLRLSLAQVDRDGPFSPYPGIERWFAVIEGAGVRLRIGELEHRLEPGHEPLRFSGAAPVDCSLIDGPTIDLNLMHAGGEAAMGQVVSGVAWQSARPLRGLFTCAAGRWQSGDAALSLPAHCLLWLERAAGASWQFFADRPALRIAALWLEFAPAVHDAGLHDADARI